MFELSVEIPFSAAHQIRGHPGQCAQLHGHNYRAIVTISGAQLDALGMVIDFGELRQLCAQVIGTLDHCYLNEVPAFAEVNPTAEAIARHVYRAVASALAQKSDIRLAVARVTIYESDRSYATYWE